MGSDMKKSIDRAEYLSIRDNYIQLAAKVAAIYDKSIIALSGLGVFISVVRENDLAAAVFCFVLIVALGNLLLSQHSFMTALIQYDKKYRKENFTDKLHRLDTIIGRLNKIILGSFLLGLVGLIYGQG